MCGCVSTVLLHCRYDEVATSHLMHLVVPLVVGYAAYSLLYRTHKSWYSWVLNSLVGFVYAFGFINMVSYATSSSQISCTSTTSTRCMQCLQVCHLLWSQLAVDVTTVLTCHSSSMFGSAQSFDTRPYIAYSLFPSLATMCRPAGAATVHQLQGQPHCHSQLPSVVCTDTLIKRDPRAVLQCVVPDVCA
jgi:Cleft lip and palate transmembrane protein 1 (CLPTM1)